MHVVNQKSKKTKIYLKILFILAKNYEKKIFFKDVNTF